MKRREFGLYLMLLLIFLQTMPGDWNWKNYVFLFSFLAAGAFYGYPENKKGENDD